MVYGRILLIFTLIPFLSSIAQAAIHVAVSIAPLADIVQTVGGEQVKVTVLVPPGASMHTYEPKPGQMKEMASAQAYFSVGDVFDAVWVPRFRSANPKLQIVELHAGIERLPMTAHTHEDDHARHGRKDDHHHEQGRPDPHIWLDPKLVIHMSHAVAQVLAQLAPSQVEEFFRNQAAYAQRLEGLDRDIRALLAPIPAQRRAFLVFHPAWGYFAHAYDLRQIPMEVHGKEPSPKQLAATIHAARQTGAKVIFVQPQVSTKTAHAVAREIGARIATLDPLAPDLVDNLRRAAQAMAEALQ